MTDGAVEAVDTVMKNLQRDGASKASARFLSYLEKKISHITQECAAFGIVPGTVPISLHALHDDIIKLKRERKPTLRDQFAMAALTGGLSSKVNYLDKLSARSAAGWSYSLADAMLEARKGTG